MQRLVMIMVGIAGLSWIGCASDNTTCNVSRDCTNFCEAGQVPFCDEDDDECGCSPLGGAGGSGGAGAGGVSTDCMTVPVGAEVITDEEFADADWDETVISPEGADTSGTNSMQAVSDGVGGAADSYRSMTHQIANPDTSDPDCSIDSCSFSMGVLHEFVAANATYTPSAQGAIDHIDYSESHLITEPSFEGAAVGWTFAVWQGGTRYTYQQEQGASAFTDLTWTAEYRCGLTSQSFAPAGLNLQDGDELTFGYIRSNTNTSPDTTQRNVHGIDNFRVVIVKQ